MSRSAKQVAGSELAAFEPLRESVASKIFPERLEVIPGLNELYELELALCESRLLSDSELQRNGAYFARVAGTPTNHYLMCRGEPLLVAQHSSSRLKSFFQENQFKTGYATHGLFPYRGKFHPQMTKALLNIMCLKPGETVLDPMMGSGTVLIEARLMGIDSIGVDASPFCVFMSKTKAEALTVPLAPLQAALESHEQVFDYFNSRVPQRGKSSPRAGAKSPSLLEWSGTEKVRTAKAQTKAGELPKEARDGPARDLLLLAYLDSAGYSERSQRESPRVQFRAILERYIFVVEKIQRVLSGVEDRLGTTNAMLGDARALSIPSGSVHGILFSPPYSFALDYVANDAFHLAYLGVDAEDLRRKMIGLIGDTPREKVENYRQDMGDVIKECSRVLKPGRLCTIVVGTNNNQIGKALEVPATEVESIPDFLLSCGAKVGFRHLRTFTRQITGMANTLRSESILVMQKA